MSDIRFNQWLHQSGTGGVTQLSSGHVGIGTTNPLIPVHSGNNAVLNVGVVTANNIYAGTLNGTLALSDISGITGSFTSDLTVNGPNLDISDKIRHIGDTNTAIRFPANDTVTIETNGSAKFHIDSTGRISSGNHGVGTYNDASEWFKVQSNNSAANISIVGSNATHSSLNLGDEDDFNIQKIRSDHTNNSLQFFTDNTERFRIDSTGRMFLGLTSSSYPKRLNIQGSSGSIIALNNNDTTSYAADTNTSIEFGLNTGNTGNQNGSCEIRAFKENGTNGNNARGLSFYTGGNGGSPAKRLVIHSEGWVEKTNQISLARYGNSNLSISNNTETVLSHFGGLAYETGGANSYWGSNKFTCPVAGMYMVYCKINLNANTGWGHDAFLAVRKNGAKDWFTGAGSDPWYDLLGANSEYYRGLYVFVNVPCAVNDEIDFLVRQNSGGTRTLYGSMCYFNIYHLG